MRRKWSWVLAGGLLAAGLALVAGCGGCRSVDRLLYDEQVTLTNRVAERVVTNAVVVTNTAVEIVEQARVVYVTNEVSGAVAGSIVREAVATNLVSSIVTNYVPVIYRVTEAVAVTNLSDRPGVLAGVSSLTGGLVDALVPGVGSLVALLLGGLYHGYRQIRNKQVTAALVQGVETARAVLTTTPQGVAVDGELVAWLKQHQREAGVLKAVAEIVEATVDNAAARGAAAEISARVKQAKGG